MNGPIRISLVPPVTPHNNHSWSPHLLAITTPTPHRPLRSIIPTLFSEFYPNRSKTLLNVMQSRNVLEPPCSDWYLSHSSKTPCDLVRGHDEHCDPSILHPCLASFWTAPPPRTAKDYLRHLQPASSRPSTRLHIECWARCIRTSWSLLSDIVVLPVDTKPGPSRQISVRGCRGCTDEPAGARFTINRR